MEGLIFTLVVKKYFARIGRNSGSIPHGKTSLQILKNIINFMTVPPMKMGALKLLTKALNSEQVYFKMVCGKVILQMLVTQSLINCLIYLKIVIMEVMYVII